MQTIKEKFKAHERNNFCYNYREDDLIKSHYNGYSNWATWNFWNHVSSKDINNINKQNALHCLEEHRYLDFLNELYPFSYLQNEDFDLFINIGMIDIVDIVNTYLEMVE